MRAPLLVALLLSVATSTAFSQSDPPVQPGYYNCYRQVDGKARAQGTIDIMADGAYRDAHGVKGSWQKDGEAHLRFRGGLLDKMRAKANSGEKHGLSFPADGPKPSLACERQ